MAGRLQAGGRDQEPDEAGEVTSGLDARGRGDGHGGHDLGQVPRGPSHACASCVWARVRPRVSCSTAHEPSACRVRRGVWGGARAARAAGVGDGPRGMEAFQPLTSYTTACTCPGRASTGLVDPLRGADLYPESRREQPQIQAQEWGRQVAGPTGRYRRAGFQMMAVVWEGRVSGPGKGRGHGDGCVGQMWGKGEETSKGTLRCLACAGGWVGATSAH